MTKARAVLTDPHNLARAMETHQTARDKNLTAKDAFWNWSSAFYARRGVAKALIALQDDHGANVNLALWCLWRNARLARTEIDEARARLSPFNTEVTAPIRAARRALGTAEAKRPETNRPETRQHKKTLRNDILAVELKAEQIEQALILGEDAMAVSPAGETDAADGYANLQTCLEFDEQSPPSALARFLAAEAAAFNKEATAP